MWLPVETVGPPVLEPVSLDEAKEFLRLDPEDSEPDLQLTGFLLAARQQVENLTGLRIVRQTIAVAAERFSDLERLPTGPVRAVDEVAYRTRDGALVVLDPARYELAGAGLAQGIRAAFGHDWPGDATIAADAVRVTMAAGFETVPQPLVLAMLLMVGDMFAFRETVAVGTVAVRTATSIQVGSLLSHYRIWR